MWSIAFILQTLLTTASSFVTPSHETFGTRATLHTFASNQPPPSVPLAAPSLSDIATIDATTGATIDATTGATTGASSTIDLAFSLDTINDDLKRTLGKKVVLQISSLLPKVDTIGHDILHANNEFVAKVLANDNMSHEFKKDIILFSIKMAQYGDDLGSFFLQQYYNIVEYSI